MKCIRQGTHKRIERQLAKHHELMQKYITEGMSKEEASKKAYDEVTGRVSRDTM